MISKTLKNDAQVFGMVFLIPGINKDVVNENHDKLVKLRINTEFMRYMKYAGAFVRPKDITKYSYNPYLVEKAILGISQGQILI